jgi:DNA-binding transcriptional LysR family regulator
MERDNASDLLAFLAVARERSFTRAAAKLGISQPALSQIVRNLEERLGVRLLSRTTRSVAPTQAGERLFRTMAPRFEEMDRELSALSELREKPAGTIRLTATEYVADAIVLPALAKILPEHPDIKVEMVIDYGLTNIIAEQYDAGIRPGELVAKDMIAVRVGPDLRMAVVGAPSYFESHKKPRTPQDLTSHNHQSQITDAWRQPLRLGVREERTRGQRSRRRPTRLQRCWRAAQCRAEGFRFGLLDGRPRASLPLDGPARSCPNRLVSAVLWVSPLLSEPSPTLAGVLVAGRCASIPALGR